MGVIFGSTTEPNYCWSDAATAAMLAWSSSGGKHGDRWSCHAPCTWQQGWRSDSFLMLLLAQAFRKSYSWNVRCFLRNQPAHLSVLSLAVAESYSEGEFTPHGTVCD